MAPAWASRCVSSELRTRATAQNVWAWLTRADLWPRYYTNAHHADDTIECSLKMDMALGMRFRRRAFGQNVLNVVEVCDSQQFRLAWTGVCSGMSAHQTWVVEPTPYGCRIVTEGTQTGLLAVAGRLLQPGSMHRMHQVWLQELAQRAEGGPPPDFGSRSISRWMLVQMTCMESPFLCTLMLHALHNKVQDECSERGSTCDELTRQGSCASAS